jgi:hypothetical protein
MAVDY